MSKASHFMEVKIESLKTIYDEERVELQTSNSFIRRMSKKD
jgi:hypothetical protein